MQQQEFPHQYLERIAFLLLYFLIFFFSIVRFSNQMYPNNCLAVPVQGSRLMEVIAFFFFFSSAVLTSLQSYLTKKMQLTFKVIQRFICISICWKHSLFFHCKIEAHVISTNVVHYFNHLSQISIMYWFG